MLTVTLIGTAATMPLPDRALAAAAIGCRGRYLLLDCGEGTQAAARRAGVSLMKVDAVCLTHYHGDHLFGLPGLLQTMGSMNRTDPLIILGPEGLEAAMAPVLTLAEELPYPLRMMELGVGGVCMHDLHPSWPKEARLSAFPTRHRVVSQGYRLSLSRPGKFQAHKARELGVPVCRWKALQQGESVTVEERMVHPQDVMDAPRRGLTVVYSGDTMPCETLDEAARDADLLICEGTYPTDDYLDKAGEWGHMTFRQAAETARRAGARRLWLTHYSAMIGDPEVYLPPACECFAQTQCGRDGMRETLQFGQ